MSHEYFPGIHHVKYEGPHTKNLLAYRYYNKEEVLLGKTMGEWLKFSVCYWHTWRGMGLDPFGAPTRQWAFDDGTETLENALRRLHAHFEFCQKLGVEYYTFHDRDIAPQGKDLAETNALLDKVVDEAEKLQKSTGVKLLWGTANLFSHPRYMNGAATNPDAHVFAYAAAQVKKAIEVTHRLGGLGYVFWGGREGYQSLLNTDMKAELKHFAHFLRSAAAYKKEIGFGGQLLIEPKPHEPTKHQYDWDVGNVISFLRGNGLDKDFKLNIEENHCTLAKHSFEHELTLASDQGFLGSIDANAGDTLLGWDLDLFHNDVKPLTLALLVVVKQGGLVGGFNFDAKIRRESTDPEDLFFGHIASIDAFARALRNAVRIIEEGTLHKWVEDRYASYKSGIGARIESGEATFAELEKYALQHGEPEKRSAKQEKFELLLNTYL
eukprot:TRINITY_DN8534_c0_g1_i1.p1 TRINITY_DN8534_c0_g1~~TRINITY_DN8534_c0_g1_i1.p1  ORF type:complete len:437 (-),score=105.78 TRINITY_DN8534_c0_g1_i1:206-1516(-)